MPKGVYDRTLSATPMPKELRAELNALEKEAKRQQTPEVSEATLAYSLAREDLAIYLALVSRTDDGKAAMPPKHLLEQVIPVLEDDRYGDTVIIAPPGSVKTNTMMGAIEWWLGRDPTMHAGYVCSTGPEAVKRSLAIRDVIEMSEEYKAIFPEVMPNKYRGWAQDQWYLERPNKGDKNPSLIAVGWGGALIGARLHKAVYDDLSDDDNTKTDLQRKAVWRFMGEIGKTRMHPTKGRQVMIGTRQHEEDAVGYALDRGWHTVHIRALDEDGESYWPEYFPTKYLACKNDEHNPTGQCCMKKELGSLGFARQYMGEVATTDTAIFKPSWWGTYDGEWDTWDRGVIVIDTAGWDAGSVTSDYAALSAWLMKGEEYHIADVVEERLSFNDVEKIALNMKYTWGLPILVEDVPWARPLIQRLQKVTSGVISWKVQGRSKFNRAEAVAPIVEAGRVSMPVRVPWRQRWIDQHAMFPGAKNDDLVDNTSMALGYLDRNVGKQRPKRTLLPFRTDWGSLSA